MNENDKTDKTDKTNTANKKQLIPQEQFQEIVLDFMRTQALINERVYKQLSNRKIKTNKK